MVSLKPNSNNKIKSTVAKIAELDRGYKKIAEERLDSLTKPAGSLGRLEELAKQISGITGRLDPDLSRKLIIVMAADHGVVDEGVSAYPGEVTPQMVSNFLAGGAGINVLARHIGADVVVVDMGIADDLLDAREIESTKDTGKPEISLINKKIAKGTENMALGPAMTEEQAFESIEAGIQVAEKMIAMGYGIIGTGDMGIGNTTASSAIAAAVCGVDAKFVTGYGTGVDEPGYIHKIDIIEKTLSINEPDPKNGIDVLAKVGGFEIGGIAGVIIACAAARIPVVIDGFISGAAALIAESIAPRCRNFMIASHNSCEKGHSIILDKLKLKPLFNFDMRLGEGTGSAIGISIAEAAVKILNEMATFDEAGVAARKKRAKIK
jgi:nicotinate-nucleotide--dimethylbenzimidazole phosphoribosyltransferase